VWQWRGQEELLLQALARKYPSHSDKLQAFQAPEDGMPWITRWACNETRVKDLSGAQAKEGIPGAVLSASPITIFCMHDQTEAQLEFLSQCQSIASAISAANRTIVQFVALDLYEYGWMALRMQGLYVHEPHNAFPMVPSMSAVAHSRPEFPRYFIGCQKFHCPESLPRPLDWNSMEAFANRVVSGDIKGQGPQGHILMTTVSINKAEHKGNEPISFAVRI
jgi:hypothetical protein